MNREELNKILEDHQKWLYGEGGKRAILQDVDLQNAYLRGANLRSAILRDCDLRGANLTRADLQGADVFGTEFRGADLRDANLQEVDVKRADLRGTDLRGADLREADLRRADLRSADLRCADLRDANLRVADIKGADLRSADLTRAYTERMEMDAETKIEWPTACPETGAFVAWKRAGLYSSVSHRYGSPCIVKLEIPADAERSSATTNKCRASKARVLEILDMDGTNADATEAWSNWGEVFYKVGEMVYPDQWDDNRWNECSHGIHFFMTREEAVAW